MPLRHTMVGLVVASAFAAVGVAADAQTPASSTTAGDLASLMIKHKLDVFAVQDPQLPNRFLAVMLIPSVQLLIVSAEYPAPAELSAQLARRNFRDVYAALHQPASAPSRFFLLDLACDGLRGKSGAVDILYEKGVTQTLFNGDWRSQDLSKALYESKVTETERRYGQILGHLTGALRASAPEV